MSSGFALRELSERIHQWAIRKEWRDPENIGARPAMIDCMLFVTEVAEAAEELRVNADPTKVWFSYDYTYNGVKFKALTREQYVALAGHNPDPSTAKPEGFGPELADILIRIFDTAAEYGINLDFEVERKMEYNETREIRHGGKLV
jgi:NTP pyrophosphatase (non-canonical NTP hydrolase)